VVRFHFSLEKHFPVSSSNLQLNLDNLKQYLSFIFSCAVHNIKYSMVVQVAALVPKTELDGEMGDAHVALQARLMSQALRKLSHSLSLSQTILLFINQVFVT
jgi:recombination protein RecA